MQTDNYILNSLGEPFVVPRNVSFVPTINIEIILKDVKSNISKKLVLNAGEVIYISTPQELYRGSGVNISSPNYEAEKAIQYNNFLIFIFNKLSSPKQLAVYKDDKHYIIDSNFICQSYNEYMRAVIKKVILPLEGIQNETLCKYMICIPNGPCDEFVLNN
jgi:hypothetical protein